MAFTYSNKNFGEMPKPGEMRRKIKVGRTLATQNENGYPENRDEYVWEGFAKVEASGYSQTHETGASVTARATNFSIRFRDDITEGMWVEFEGKKWSIIDTVDYDERRQYLGMRTITVQEVSG